MAVVELNSKAITDIAANKLVDSNIQNASLKESCGSIATGAGDSSASVLRFFQVPSNARVSQILLSCTDLGSTGAADIGLYRTLIDGGAAVDVDLFASAQVLTTALVNSDVTHESGEYTLVEAEKPLWEVLGLTADPHLSYDVAATLTQAAELAGTVHLKGRFVI